MATEGRYRTEIEITDEEVWELVMIAIDSLSIGGRVGAPFTAGREIRHKLALDLVKRNFERLPIRILGRVQVLPAPSPA